jgi:hypothetical protein
MLRPTATNTVNVLRRLFSQHGLPEVIVSDNGTQFTSTQFIEFCRENGIEHIRSPPYHPQSNGQAERFVDTFKRALLKSQGEGTTEEILQRFLLVYRSTPNPQTPNNKTPAEVLMGRKLRNINDALLPKEGGLKINTKHAGTSELPVNTPVYARDYRPGYGKWAEGTIAARRGKVLYEIIVNGGTWIRHRNQLRPRHVHNSDENPPDLPLDILLDTFDINASNQPAETHLELPGPADSRRLPRRRTDRVRRPPVRIQVDPRRQYY